VPHPRATAGALALFPGPAWLRQRRRGRGHGRRPRLDAVGRLTFPAAASVLRRVETETNDTIDTATDLGTLAAGDRLTIDGSTSALSELDPFDGFTVTLPSRVRVRATVAAVDGLGLDPDLHVYDPTGLQVFASSTADGAIETTTFVGKGSTRSSRGGAARGASPGARGGGPRRARGRDRGREPTRAATCSRATW
jgi:hypothetical protein